MSGALALAAASSPPAGGAAAGQVIGATAAAVVLTTALLVLGLGHRSGRIRLLGYAAAESSRASGLPGWAALPAGLAAVSLLDAVFGLYWDISLHIDNGRDPGPLANPSHYFILVGLFGIFSAGWLSIVLPTGRPSPAAVRITRDWHAPVGGVVLMSCASFALLGFPLDDMWHRLFGQDVTLWGPTHLMMLTGAAMTLVGILLLLTEARLARPATPVDVPWTLRLPDLVLRVVSPLSRWKVRSVAACGGFLAALSIYQGEFDFGVPQFRLLFDPVLIALAASVALVTARIVAGRGAALGAAVFFLAIRALLTLIVGTGLGETVAHFPLYLAEAALVEIVALRVSTERPYLFGAVAGSLAGSVGVASEFGWSHVWAPLPWPAHMLAAAVGLSLPVAIAGGVIGAFLGGALRLRADVAATPRAYAAVAASVVVVGAVMGYLLHTTVPTGARASVTLATVRPAPGREVHATVRLDPPSLARDAEWFYAIAWQGHRRLVVSPLRRIGHGLYRTTRRLPVYGGWKSGLRLQRGNEMAGVPVYLPEDRAIPAAGVPAPARFDRAFRADRKILQRERKEDVPGWLWSTASSAVLALALGLLGLLGWALARLAACESPKGERDAAGAREPARPAAGVA
jgi:hypothetical protein